MKDSPSNISSQGKGNSSQRVQVGDSVVAKFYAEWTVAGNRQH